MAEIIRKLKPRAVMAKLSLYPKLNLWLGTAKRKSKERKGKSKERNGKNSRREKRKSG